MRKFMQIFLIALGGFFKFENSVHSPLFEEPEKVLKIIEKRGA